MKHFIVHEDGMAGDRFVAIAANINDALDAYAYSLGYVDYPDMCLERNWPENAPINILECVREN